MSRPELVRNGLRHVHDVWGWKVNEANIFSRQNFHPYSHARWYLCAYIQAARPDWSMPMIARAMEWKNHTSVLYALRRAHGHDGKLVERFAPLWTKEHFENLVAEDDANIRFVNGSGWEAAA